MYVTFASLERCVAPNTTVRLSVSDESAEYSLGGRNSFDCIGASENLVEYE